MDTQSQLNAAASAIEAIAKGQPIKTKNGTAKLLQGIQVGSGMGSQFARTEPQKNSTAQLEFFLKSEELRNDPDLQIALSERLLEAFKQIPAISDVAAVEPWSEHVERLGKEITTELKKLSPEVAEEIGKWPGFHKEYGANIVSDYAATLNESNYNFQIILPIPTKPGGDDSAEKTAEAIASQISAAKERFKAGLKRAAQKYVPDMKKEDLDKFDALDVRANTSSQNKTNTVLITLFSPDQVKAKEEPSSAKDMDALKKSNPLSLIPQEKLGKAVGRALLYTGPDFKQPAEYFSQVAGRLDMKAALGRLLHKAGTSKDVAKRLLEDDVFKQGNQWNLPQEKRENFLRAPSLYVKPEHPDTLHVELSLPLDKKDQVLSALANLKHGCDKKKPEPKKAEFSPIITDALSAIPGQPEHDNKVKPSPCVTCESVKKNGAEVGGAVAV